MVIIKKDKISKTKKINQNFLKKENINSCPEVLFCIKSLDNRITANKIKESTGTPIILYEKEETKSKLSKLSILLVKPQAGQKNPNVSLKTQGKRKIYCNIKNKKIIDRLKKAFSLFEILKLSIIF